MKSINMRVQDSSHSDMRKKKINPRTDWFRILANNKINVNSTNKKEQTLLHLVNLKKQNQPQIIKLLICLKANVDALDSFGLTPLQYAAARGLTENMRTLLENKASVNTDNFNTSSSALFCLAFYFKTKKNPQLMRRQAEGINLLIEHKADVALRPVHKMSALYLVAASGNIPAVISLLYAGAKDIQVCSLPEFPQAARVVDLVGEVLSSLRYVGIFQEPQIAETIVDYVLPIETEIARP